MSSFCKACLQPLINKKKNKYFELQEMDWIELLVLCLVCLERKFDRLSEMGTSLLRLVSENLWFNYLKTFKNRKNLLTSLT